MDKAKKYEAGSLVNLDIKEDEINFLEMQETIRKTHARKRDGTKYSAGDACCRASTGCHFCLATSKSCEFERFDVGVALYFRYIKYLILFFFLYTLLNIPSIYFSVKVAQEYENRSYDYKSLLFYTTLGSLGKGRASCGLANLNSNNIVQFSCPVRDSVIDSYSTLEWGVSLDSGTEGLTCDLYSLFSWDPTGCKNANTTAIQNEYSKCWGKKSCSFNVTEDMWDTSSCPGIRSSQLYFNAYCTGGTVQLPGGKRILLTTATFVISCCDAALSVFFLWMIISLSISEDKAIRNLRKKSLTSGIFTVEVMNLPRKANAEELRGALWDHFEKAVNARNAKPGDFIEVVDVQFAQTHTLMVKEEQLGTLTKKRKGLLRKFVTKFSAEKDIESLDTAAVFPIAEKNKKARPMAKKVEKLNKRIEKTRNKIEHEKKFPSKKILSAFITFEKILARNRALVNLSSSPFEQCCYRCCCCCYSESFQIFKGKFLKVREAPDAQNVLWQNLSISTLSKVLRRLLSFSITVILWVATFVVIILIKHEQEKLGDNVRPTIDCSGFSATAAQVAADAALGSAAKGYVECYCRDNTLSKVNQVFNVNGSQEKLCQQWLTNKSLVMGLPFVIAFGIVFINIILKKVYELLSSFEGHRNVTKALSSKIIKIFVSQFLNTGLLLLVISARFTSKSPTSLLSGQFDDMNPTWYYAVGATLLLTMLINVFSFPITVLVFTAIKSLLRCCDRSCRKDPQKTKKKSQKSYINLYTGPEFGLDFRYAQVLTLIFICMFYGSGLPLLYFFTFVQLIILYWIDKCFFLRINRLPRGYDEFLAKTVRSIMYYIIILHLAISVWNFGNDKIFENSGVLNSVLKYKTFIDYVNYGTMVSSGGRQYYIEKWIRSRIFRDQTIIPTVLLFLFALVLILKFFFQHITKRLIRMCCAKHDKGVVSGSLESISYYDVMNRAEIRAEQELLNEAINETTDPLLKKKLENKQTRLRSIEERIFSTNEDENPFLKFIGIFSYDIRHNPIYKNKFGLDMKSISRSGPRSPTAMPRTPTININRM
mmetsp:Transcript_9202/g.10359  ORF Transcript_9202/g.10359 Transcript_9202/m.10359 type:complete len:1049 (-) Transcript_9202:179-3325(-)|eukprot:CAMPEP_0176466388 /NCGR_PEP_ID=MMETSP0127-20121128/37861_1 /TAXON_ID=938130 /ORGANISM="Platyophrya macrostoma, Strain WH" /LENGTH=1048 /DNA_ID=CAMNT_0017859543 /DNA_START=68 /DNA_END=3217 /DNA_ORIENTATION=-